MVAIYGSSMRCLVVKNPPQALGLISIDGTSYPDTDSVSVWLRGDDARIGGQYTRLDRLHALRLQQLDRGPATAIWSTPVLIQPTVFTANYTREWRLILVKNPLEAYGYFRVNGPGLTGARPWPGWPTERIRPSKPVNLT